MAQRPLINPREIPIIGPWSAKMGHVIKITSMPCNPDPTIVVTAAFHAFPHLLWALVKPSPDDYFDDKFQRRHKKRRRRKLRIQDYQVGGPSPRGKIGTFAFNVFSAAERIGWYFLVVDATLDFAVHWTSTAYQWTGCPVPGAPYANAVYDGVLSGYGPGNDITFISWGNGGDHIFEVNLAGVVCNAGYYHHAALSMQCKPIPGLRYAPISNVRMTSSLPTRADIVAQRTDSPGGVRSFYAEVQDWNFTSPHETFRAVFDVEESGFQDMSGSYLKASGTKQPGLTFDP